MGDEEKVVPLQPRQSFFEITFVAFVIEHFSGQCKFLPLVLLLRGI